MPEYAGFLKGARLRRLDDRADAQRAERTQQNIELKKERAFNRQARIREIKGRERQNILAGKRLAQQDTRLARQDTRAEAEAKRRASADTITSEKYARTKKQQDAEAIAATLSPDELEDIYGSGTGTKKSGFKTHTSMKRNPDGSITAVRPDGTQRTISQFGVIASVKRYRSGQANIRKREDKDREFKLKKYKAEKSATPKKSIDATKMGEYYETELEKLGYGITSLRDEEGKPTPALKNFAQSMNMFRKQGDSEQEAIIKATKHAGIRKTSDYTGRLAAINAKMGKLENEGKGSAWFSLDTPEYNKLEAQKEELKNKPPSTSRISVSKSKKAKAKTSTQRDTRMVTWAKSNPNDPRSKRILERNRQK